MTRTISFCGWVRWNILNDKGVKSIDLETSFVRISDSILIFHL